ncbi:MAG TPA: phytanoyl-CoA dioxygenase family protein, partial [Chthonomonadales bacterium]|nr:phytanoyl-CoA dioxygenase family protein [Chthonomonadales bacterium]
VARARAAMCELVDREAGRLQAAGRMADPHIGAPLETRLLLLYERCPQEAKSYFRAELHLAGLFPLFFHPGLLDLIEGVLGPEIRLYPNYTARPKLPEQARTLVLWHQDGGYTGGEANTLRMVNVWTPLVPVTVENGCMEFIPRTHRLGMVPHEMREYYLEIAEEYLASRRQDAIAMEAAPGDVILFHNLLFHRGLPNHAQTIRWSLDWRYQDATQPTLREENGHLARSVSRPGEVIRTAEQWASLSFS